MIDVAFHLRPIVTNHIDEEERVVELVELGALEFIRPGSVARCCAGYAQELDENRTIDEIHERVRVMHIVAIPGETNVLLLIERGVDGTRSCWHDSGCLFKLVDSR